ncbi:TPA: relaxase domain-containing protein [Escherichia coli]|nr:relaxase domain-containing protein [Escherichia coli]
MLSFSVVKSAGSAGNYYTDKDNYYVLGSMGERWAGQGAEQLGLQGSVDKDVWHCCKVSDEAAFCLIQRPYISKTLLTRRISPRGSP